MVEYKTRRRETAPRRGEKVWHENRKLPPQADGIQILDVHGKIVSINWQDQEVVVLFEHSQHTYAMDEIRDAWSDGLDCYLIEEEASPDAVPLNGAIIDELE